MRGKTVSREDHFRWEEEEEEEGEETLRDRGSVLLALAVCFVSHPRAL